MPLERDPIHGNQGRNIRTRYTTTPFNSTLYYISNTTNACAWTGAAVAQ